MIDFCWAGLIFVLFLCGGGEMPDRGGECQIEVGKLIVLETVVGVERIK